MKQSMKHAFCLLVLFAFAVGCGKDSGGGRNSYSNSLLDPGTIPANSTTEYQAIMTWYNGIEPSTRGNFQRINNSISNGTNGNYCNGSVKTWGPISICITSNNGSGSNSGTVTYNFISSVNGVIQTCESTSQTNCTQYQNYSGKATNTALQQALNGKGGALRLIQVTNLGQGIYALGYTNNFYGTVNVVYKIDTKLHSVYNPVEIVDLSSSSGTQMYIQFPY